MDAFVRRFSNENSSYRFVVFSDGDTAFALEACSKAGNREDGEPFLKPHIYPRLSPPIRCDGALLLAPMRAGKNANVRAEQGR
jgi:hypothetical protein